MVDAIIRINDDLYLPISDLTIIYNINVQYIPSTKIVIIDNLNKGIIRAMVSEETDIKFRPRRLSKNIGTLKEGETVYCFYTTSKGWRKIRTQDGILGYIKANKLTSEYIIRQDMKVREEAIIIPRSNYSNEMMFGNYSRLLNTIKESLKSLVSDLKELYKVKKEKDGSKDELGVVTQDLSVIDAISNMMMQKKNKSYNLRGI